MSASSIWRKRGHRTNVLADELTKNNQQLCFEHGFHESTKTSIEDLDHLFPSTVSQLHIRAATSWVYWVFGDR